MTVRRGMTAACAGSMRRKRWNAPIHQMEIRPAFEWTMPLIEPMVIRKDAEVIIPTGKYGTTASICDITVSRVKWLERPLPV